MGCPLLRSSSRWLRKHRLVWLVPRLRLWGWDRWRPWAQAVLVVLVVRCLLVVSPVSVGLVSLVRMVLPAVLG